MKKDLIALLISMLSMDAYASQAVQSDMNHWSIVSFDLDNGFRVIRTPTKLTVSRQDQSLDMASYRFYEKSHNLFGIYPTADGTIDVNMSYVTFIDEVMKLGAIKECVFVPFDTK
jgi:hypothetical protein